MMSAQILFICTCLLIGTNAQDPQVESRMSEEVENITVPIPMRMAVNPSQVYNQAPISRDRVSYQPQVQEEEEEYQQTMRDIGLRPTNYQDNPSSAYFPSSNNFNPYQFNRFAGSDNFYSQPTSTIQRVIVSDKPTENSQQNQKPEINFQSSQSFAGAPHIDVAMSPADLANLLQNSNFAFINPNQNQNFRNNFEFPQQNNKQNGNFASMIGQTPNVFVPAVAFTQPMNNMFQRPINKQQMRPMMNQGANLMGANTLTMPMFFAPNMGMTRMNMPYPTNFNPMVYPSPMFIPNVNPYAPFFPKKYNKSKQKVKSENRDDRDDAEELFEDDIEEVEK